MSPFMEMETGKWWWNCAEVRWFHVVKCAASMAINHMDMTGEKRDA
jgi:hypothetical protein